MKTPPSQDARIFIVDDDASVRRSLARLMKSAGYTAETFATAGEFFDRAQYGEGPACLVLDVGLPDWGGLEVQRKLAQCAPLIPIIFITGQGDILTSVQAMKRGAVDFLPKPFSDEVLLRAIGIALARNARERAAHAARAQLQARFATLTPREREVLALVVTGLLNKQVADRLGTTEKTIKVHRGRVMQKMGVASFAELVRAAAKLDLATDPPAGGSGDGTKVQ